MEVWKLEERLTRGELQQAIAPWWRGGGLASSIVEVLHEREGSLEEARALAKRLARRAETGNTYWTRDIVDEHLEVIRASVLSYKSKMKKDDGPDWDLCLYSDDEDCPQCKALDIRTARGEPAWRHGRLLSREEMRERLTEVRYLLNALNKERPE
jgi:hypothetical protein